MSLAPVPLVKGLWECPERLQELPKGAKMEKAVAGKRQVTTFRDPPGPPNSMTKVMQTQYYRTEMTGGLCIP